MGTAAGTREGTREGAEGGTEGATEGTADEAAGEAVEEGIRAARVAAAGLAAETISAVEAGAAAVTIEAVGGDSKLKALLAALEPYGIKEIVQSGVVAISRGSRSLTDRAERSLRTA